MKKIKLLGKILFCIVAIAIIAVGGWGIKIYLREQDSRWQMAKEIYKVQTALQAVDEDWELASLSKVIPSEITRPDGSIIHYYCCITSYLNEEPGELEGMNKAALSQVVDVDTLENIRNCKEGNFDAIIGEIDDQAYLYWTISPKYSCVISSTPGTVAEEDIFRMAGRVSLAE